MARTADLQKEQFWQSHITQAKDFNGSINKYCQMNGLKIQNFKYWKSRISKISAKSMKPVASPFFPVRVLSADLSLPERSMPDPKWIAEVLFELHARCR